MNIGLVDLDTSHPASWLPHLRALGHDVVGVWDGGGVHPAGYAERFITEHGIARVFPTLEAMAEAVDLAIVHSANWDMHVARIAPFVTAGRAVLVDKPIAGNRRDLAQIGAWVAAGARITGGSSLRVCREAQAWQAGGAVAHTALCGCGVDEFNYGIHAYALLSGLLGPGIISARHLSTHGQRRIQLTWADGRVGWLVVGPADWFPFYATLVSDSGVTYLTIDTDHLYRALLEAMLPYLAGETDTPPLPWEALIEPELAALAARESWRHGDVEVRLDAVENDGYDGTAFAATYRDTKYPLKLS